MSWDVNIELVSTFFVLMSLGGFRSGSIELMDWKISVDVALLMLAL